VVIGGDVGICDPNTARSARGNLTYLVADRADCRDPPDKRASDEGPCATKYTASVPVSTSLSDLRLASTLHSNVLKGTRYSSVLPAL